MILSLIWRNKAFYIPAALSASFHMLWRKDIKKCNEIFSHPSKKVSSKSGDNFTCWGGVRLKVTTGSKCVFLPTPGREILKSFPIHFCNIDIANWDKPRITKLGFYIRSTIFQVNSQTPTVKETLKTSKILGCKKKKPQKTAQPVIK